MTTKTKYRIFAVMICIVIYFIYIVIATELGWKHGGGVLVLAILFGIISWVWKTAGELAAKKDAEKARGEKIIEQAESLKTGEMPAEGIEIQPIPELSSEEASVEEPVYAELPPIPVSEEVVEEAPKASEVFPEEPNTNPSTNENKKNKRTGLIILICIIATILLSGVIAYSLVVIPKNKQRKAVEELYTKGQEAYDKDLYELAIKNFSEAVQLDNTNWALKYMLGNCYYEQDSYQSACSWYEEAYELNSERKDVIVAKDTLHYKSYLGRYTTASIREHPLAEKSLLLAQEFYNLYPNDVSAYNLITMAYVHYAGELDFDKKKQKHYQNMSLQWGNKMVAAFPDNDDSYFCLAYAQAQIGDDRAAIENYKKCLELNPSNKLAYNNIGCCYEKIYNNQEAYRYWRKAVQLGETKCAPDNLKRHKQPLK